jgi:hypothetical protein
MMTIAAPSSDLPPPRLGHDDDHEHYGWEVAKSNVRAS